LKDVGTVEIWYGPGIVVAQKIDHWISDLEVDGSIPGYSSVTLQP